LRRCNQHDEPKSNRGVYALFGLKQTSRRELFIKQVSPGGCYLILANMKIMWRNFPIPEPFVLALIGGIILEFFVPYSILQSSITLLLLGSFLIISGIAIIFIDELSDISLESQTC
jgi:hypothetical protein